MSAELSDVCRRLERLERQNRLLKLSLVFGLLAAGVGALVAADKPAEPKKAEAESFLVVDGKGVKRAALEVTKDGPSLQFFDADGKERGRFALTDEGLTTRYLTNRGRLSAGISLQTDGVCLAALPAGTPAQVGSNAIRTTSGAAFAPDVRPGP